MPRTKEQSERLSRNLGLLTEAVTVLMRRNNSGDRLKDLLEVADAIAAMLYTHLALARRTSKPPLGVASEALQKSATICELTMAMLGHKLGGGNATPIQMGMAIGDLTEMLAASWNEPADPRSARELIRGSALGVIKAIGKAGNCELSSISDRMVELAAKFADEAIEIVNSAKPFDPENN